jgi:GTPase SAR1 family protein
VTGDSGSGKTTLLVQVVRHLRARGLRVLAAGVFDREIHIALSLDHDGGTRAATNRLLLTELTAQGDLLNPKAGIDVIGDRWRRSSRWGSHHPLRDAVVPPS